MSEFEKKLYAHATQVKTHMTSPVNIERKEFEEIKVGKRISRRFILVAAIVILLSTAVVAATLNWDEGLVNLLHPTEKQQEELLGSINTPLVSAEENGLKVEVKQTLADNHGIYVLYELTAPDWIELNDDMCFNTSLLKVKAAEGVGGTGEKIIAQSANKRTALIYHSAHSGNIENQNLALTLGNFGYWQSNEDYSHNEFITLVEGEWNLEWMLNYVDTTKTIAVNKKVDVNGTNDNTITTIDISPMSVFITIEGDDLWTAFRPIIKFKDGNQIEIEAANNFNHSYSFYALADQITGNDDGSAKVYGAYSIGYRFDQITDISTIESIQIRDVIVKIK